MLTLLAEIRYASRRLRKSPAFTLVAIITLALGVGNTAIFTLLDQAIVRSLPVRHPEQLVRLRDTIFSVGDCGCGYFSDCFPA